MTLRCDCGRRASQQRPGGGWLCEVCVPALKCPLCNISSFTVRGLRAHHCRSTPDRRRLTADEHEAAVKAAITQSAIANPKS